MFTIMLDILRKEITHSLAQKGNRDIMRQIFLMPIRGMSVQDAYYIQIQIAWFEFGFGTSPNVLDGCF